MHRVRAYKILFGLDALAFVLCLALLGACTSIPVEEREARRAQIDQEAEETIALLSQRDPEFSEALEQSAGYMTSLISSATVCPGCHLLKTGGRPDIIPSKGMSESPRATEVPKLAITSASFSLSIEITLAITWVSFMKSSGNKGLIGRSIKRDANISFSLGRASLLKNPPGIFPVA